MEVEGGCASGPAVQTLPPVAYSPSVRDSCSSILEEFQAAPRLIPLFVLPRIPRTLTQQVRRQKFLGDHKCPGWQKKFLVTFFTPLVAHPSTPPQLFSFRLLVPGQSGRFFRYTSISFQTDLS